MHCEKLINKLFPLPLDAEVLMEGRGKDEDLVEIDSVEVVNDRIILRRKN